MRGGAWCCVSKGDDLMRAHRQGNGDGGGFISFFMSVKDRFGCARRGEIEITMFRMFGWCCASGDKTFLTAALVGVGSDCVPKVGFDDRFQ